MAPLDMLERRAKDAVRSELQAAQARVYREASIVQMAKKSLASQTRLPGETQKGGQKLRPGVYARNTMDGYRRLSPVQEIRTAPGYRAAILKRAIGAVAAAAVIVAAAVFLLRVL